jgi:hypothetical protein
MSIAPSSPIITVGSDENVSASRPTAFTSS